jgi:hypothetical protein
VEQWLNLKKYFKYCTRTLAIFFFFFDLERAWVEETEKHSQLGNSAKLLLKKKLTLLTEL